MMQKYFIPVTWVAIAGNVLFILWVVYNAIDSGGAGTIYEKISFVGLITLLILNIALLIFYKKRLS